MSQNSASRHAHPEWWMAMEGGGHKLKRDMVRAALEEGRSISEISAASGAGWTTVSTACWDIIVADGVAPPRDMRVSPVRKAETVGAINRQALTVARAALIWSVSEAEIELWAARFWKYGVRGLSATRVQQYRDAQPAE